MKFRNKQLFYESSFNLSDNFSLDDILELCNQAIETQDCQLALLVCKKIYKFN